MVFVVAMVMMVCVGMASAWYDDWDYRRAITINNAGSGLTDYQVLITLNSSNFDYSRANSDGSGIRFTDTNDNLLSYWIEDWNTSGDSKIWVNVSSVPSGDSTIYIYYGNTSAYAMSNGDATFEFFDDFEDGTYTDKWEVVNGGWDESGGVMKSTTGSQWDQARIKSKKLVSPNGGWLVMKHDYYLDNKAAGYSGSMAVFQNNSGETWDRQYGSGANSYDVEFAGGRAGIHYPDDQYQDFDDSDVLINTWYTIDLLLIKGDLH